MFKLSENEIKDIFSLYEAQQLVANLALFICNESEIKKHISNEKNSVSGSVYALQEELVLTPNTIYDKDDNPQLNAIFQFFNLNGLYLFPFRDELQYFVGWMTKNGYKNEKDRSLISFFNIIERMLDNSRLQLEIEIYTQKTKKMITEIGAIHEISRAIDSSESLDLLLKYIVEKCMAISGSEAASLMLVCNDRTELEFNVVLGPKADSLKPFRLPMGKGIAGWVAQNAKPILIPDAYADSRFDPSFDKSSGFRTRSYLCVPLIHKEIVIGVLTLLNRLDGHPYTTDDQALVTTFASQAALSIENAKLLQAAIEKERLDKELQVAAEIQSLLIPQILPQIPGLDVASTYLPCKEVGGDFYDIIQLDKKRFVFVIADVSGKGVPGALLVSTMQAALVAYLENNQDLLYVVDRLNHRIIENTTDDRYITFFIGLYNSETSTFSYINAGHNPPLWFNREKGVQQLQKGGIFIGYMPWEYETESIELQKNDTILLYTDGLVEAMNDKEEEFGVEPLQQIVEISGNKKSSSLLDSIRDNVLTHLAGTPLDDDFTVVVLRSE